jgi:hypothetical protein
VKKRKERSVKGESEMSEMRMGMGNEEEEDDS